MIKYLNITLAILIIAFPLRAVNFDSLEAELLDVLEKEGYGDKGFQLYKELQQQYYNNDLKRGIEFSYDLLEHALKNNQYKTAHAAYSQLASLYTQLEIFDKAIEASMRSLKFAMIAKDTGAYYWENINIGNLYYRVGRYDTARVYFRISFDKFSRDIKNHPLRDSLENIDIEAIWHGMAVASNNIALCHINSGNIDSALHYLNNSYDIRRKFHNDFLIAHSQNYLGEAYSLKDELDKSLKYFQLARDNAIRHLNSNQLHTSEVINLIASTLQNEGQIFYNRGNIKNANALFDSATAILQKYDHQVELIYNRSFKVLFLRELGDIDGAIENALWAAHKAHDVGIITQSSKLYKELSGLYEQKDDFEKAYFYLNKYHETEDSIASFNKTRMIEEIELRHKYDDKINELVQLEKEKQLALQQRETQIKFILLIAFLILIIAGVAIYLNIFRKRTQEQLKKKNSELEKLINQLQRSEKALEKSNQRLEQANKILSDSEKELKELNGTKDRFFSIIAHDLRNSLGSFMNLSQTLSNDYDMFTKEDQKELLEVMKNSSFSLYQLLENLLTWSRSQRGLIQLNKTDFDLGHVASEIVEQSSLKAGEKGITLENLVPENTFLLGDVNIVNTILRNLVNNAIKFTGSGGTVTIDYSPANDYHLISVKDTGIGMSHEKLRSLFKVDKSKSEKGTGGESGTGLGLIICKEFVEKHGGKIWATSRQGMGSTFFFTIPSVGVQKGKDRLEPALNKN